MEATIIYCKRHSNKIKTKQKNRKSDFKETIRLYKLREPGNELYILRGHRPNLFIYFKVLQTTIVNYM